LGVWERVQRALFRRGINTVLEVVLWLTMGYVVIGVGYVVLHVELMTQLESALSGTFPIFADIAALAVMVAGWPFLWLTALGCGVSGCGMF